MGFTFNPLKSTTGFNPQFNINSSETPDNIFLPKCGQTSLAKENYHRYVKEYADRYGMTISYQPVAYDQNTHNPVYGENAVSGQYNARKIKAVVDFKEYSAFLTKFGFQSSETLTVYIPIREFNRVWGTPDVSDVYPLAGDIFTIDDSACDRPLGQSELVWEVIEKTDLHTGTVDFLSGSYVWKCDCKRFINSYEKNIPEEKFLDEASKDTEEFGRLPGGDNPARMSPKISGVDDFTKSNFDNSKISSGYGKYI